MIGIDEAQFFEGLYDFCREAADLDGKTVIVAGLDGDYLRYQDYVYLGLDVSINLNLFGLEFATPTPTPTLFAFLVELDRRSFGSVLDIIPLADTVTKLTAQCELCGKHALFTLRKSNETQTELIGGSDVYMPVCRQHYVSGQAVIETTSSVVLESQVKKVQCG